MLRRVEPDYRWPVLLFLAVAFDAAVTFVGIAEMGPGIEGNPLARLYFDQIDWLDFGLTKAAALYFIGYLGVGAVVAGVLYRGRRHIQAAPLGRYFAPALTIVFTLSAVANIYAFWIWLSAVRQATLW